MQPASITWAGPMAMPSETPSPSMMRSRVLRLASLAFFQLFIEAALHQLDEGGKRLGLGAPLARSSISVPGAAASIISPMIEAPETVMSPLLHGHLGA